MKIVKFASIVMGEGYTPESEKAFFQNPHNDTSFFGVSSLEEACKLAVELKLRGYECLELCGAFGADGAQKVIKATDGKIAVGFSIHLPEQDDLFDRLFS